MKAFVTGGTGFIGSHLVDALLENDVFDEVRCLVRNKEKWLEGKTYIKVTGDLHSIKVIDRAMDGVDTVFHCAALVKASSEKEFRYANVDATENIVRLANRHEVAKLVILSSQAAAGPSNGEPLNEEDPLEPISMYGRSKKEMEQLVTELAKPELSVSILRPPAVYGPREDQILTLFKMMNYGIAPVIAGDQSPKLSIVYVMDLVQALLKAAENKKPGVHTYFISGEEAADWEKMAEIVSTVLGKKSYQLPIKPNWVKKIAGAVETTASFFGTYPVVNREKADEMVHEWLCSYEKAERELGYQPQYSLEEGISRTLRWYKKHNWIR